MLVHCNYFLHNLPLLIVHNEDSHNKKTNPKSKIILLQTRNCHIESISTTKILKNLSVVPHTIVHSTVQHMLYHSTVHNSFRNAVVSNIKSLVITLLPAGHFLNISLLIACQQHYKYFYMNSHNLNSSSYELNKNF